MAKAQIMIFEQVLLFLISVAIFISCFSLFSLYQNHFSFIALNDQVKAVRDVISSQVLELARFEEMNISTRLRVPKKISGERYRMEFTGPNLTIITEETRTSASADFSRIASGYIFSGNSIRSKGEIIIYKRGNNIILG